MARARGKIVRIDAWRAYRQPPRAVVDASDTGTWSDSPCPTPRVKAELSTLAKALRKAKIPVRSRTGHSSNVFCMKRYLVVPSKYVTRARKIVARESKNMSYAGLA